MQKNIHNPKALKKIPRGFTIIELIVVMSIFAMMAGLVLFRYKDFGEGVNLENTTQEIALQIQKAENDAVAGRYPALINANGIQQTPPLPTWRPSYGVYFTKNSPKQFVSFFDWNDGTSTDLAAYGSGVGRGYFDQSDTINPISVSVPSCGTTSIGSAECLDIMTIATNESIYDLCQGTTCGLSNLSVVFTRPFPDRIAVYNSKFGASNSVASGDVRVRVQGEGTSGCRDIYVTPLGQIYIKTVACQS